MIDTATRNRVKDAELALLDADTRRDPRRVRELLHPSFVEIGRSGRRWTRDDIVEALAGESGRTAPETDEWQFVDLAPHLVLVTYLLSSPAGRSRHASVWDVSGGSPVMRFHQGTPIAADL